MLNQFMPFLRLFMRSLIELEDVEKSHNNLEHVQSINRRKTLPPGQVDKVAFIFYSDYIIFNSINILRVLPSISNVIMHIIMKYIHRCYVIMMFY